MEDGRKQVALQWKKMNRSSKESAGFEQRKKMWRGSYRDWAELPATAVDDILDKLNLYDYVNFATVCVKWRSTALDQRNHRGKMKKNQPWEDDHQLPLLMVAPVEYHRDYPAVFYSVTQKSRISDLKLPVPFYVNRLIGSSFGWIISIDTDFVINLSNPFSPSSASIRLPPVLNPKLLREDNVNSFGSDNIDLFGRESVKLYQSASKYYIVKAILSADPAKDYVVMVIYGLSRRLAFIRPRAGAASPPHWIYLDFPMQGFSDVIYSKSTRLFHALRDKTGEVCTIKIHEEGDKYDCFITTPSLEIEGKRADHHYLCYIVETCEGDLLQVVRSVKTCGGDLLQVVRNVTHITTRSTDEIKVYKLEENGQDGKIREWAEVKELGDNALFLGDSASMSVAPSQYPHTFCRPGSIYFLLPYFNHLMLFGRQIYICDMGVANIQQRDRPGGEPFRFHAEKYTISKRPPIWIIPTFQGTPPCKKNYNFDGFF